MDDNLTIDSIDTLIDLDEKLLDPENDEMNQVITNHINDSILLFNLQNKFNNYINTKIENKLNTNISNSLSESDNELIIRLLNTNQILLIKLNYKIDEYLFYNSLCMGLGIGILGLFYIYR